MRGGRWGGRRHGFPSLPRTTPLGSFLGGASEGDAEDLVATKDSVEEPSDIIDGRRGVLVV